MVKAFKNLFLQNQISLGGLIYAQIIGNERSTKIANDIPTLIFDLFTARSNLLHRAFVWALYIYMGINDLDISAIDSDQTLN